MKMRIRFTLWAIGATRIVAASLNRYNPLQLTQSARLREFARPAGRRGISVILMRVGIGHDTHRLGQGGPLRLGGIEIPHDKHLIGHSDADVLLHAITDALLGAAALGDIGELFPDTDAANRGRDSADMLRQAYIQVRQAGYQIVNLDCIVFAQRPKLSPHKDYIRIRIAEILGIEEGQVGVKAKTGEHVGEIGREEIMMAQCVCLLDVISL